MKGKSALMVGVAAIAFAATAQAGFAAKGNSDGTSNAVAASSATQEQVDQLSQRVDALEAELQQSEVREAADHNAVSSWKPMTGWWDNTSISGRMYYDLSNISNKNNGTASTSNGTSFDIKRFYLGVDHKFDDTYSANLTTDFTYASLATETNTTQIYLKKAYLQAAYDPAFTIRIGSADMPWVPYAESVYGYRFVENTLIDRIKFGNSADWGLHILGKFADGLISYQFSAVTGAGYKKPIRTNSPDYEGRISLDYAGFQLAVGGYDGHEGALHGAVIHHTYERLDALAAYNISGFKVGVEYFDASNKGNETGAVTTTTHGYGYSPFASYQFDPQWGVFGRYDYVKPYSQDAAHKAFKNNYFNVGIDYRPTKIVDFALVYKNDAGQNGSIGNSNGTIGGTAFAAGNNGHYSEIGIFGDFQW